MPKAAILQSSFSSGQLSPLLYGQATLPKYKAGLEVGLNYVPTLQGPLVRRPGNKYCILAKDATKPPVLIPFTFSITQAYQLEFGDKYIRFYANNGRIVTSVSVFRFDTCTVAPGLPFYATRASSAFGINEGGVAPTSVGAGNILEISSPYAWQDVPQLKWTQSEDTLYIYHPSYPTYKLQRFGQNYWQLSQVLYQDGPYLALNSYSKLGDSLAIQFSYSTGFYPYGQITTQPVLTITNVVTDPGGSGHAQITFSAAHGLTTGNQIFVKNVVGTTEINNNIQAGGFSAPYSWTVTVNGTSTVIIGVALIHTYVSGGTAQLAIFQNDLGMVPAVAPDYLRNIGLDIGGARFYGNLTSFVDAATAAVYMGPISQPVVPAPGTTTAWQMGVFVAANGFPACGTFHQNRLCVAGAPGAPQEVDCSMTGNFEQFSASTPQTLEVNDENALSFQLNSRDVNAIQWLSSTSQALLAGSYSAEWAMTPSSNSEALTPTNFNAQQTSFFGAANTDAVQSGNATIYIQRSGRKVREMNFFFQVGTFRSTDLTELSENITLPSVIKLVVQKETQPLIWGLRSDGALVSMIYDRNDTALNAGWMVHTLGGQSDAAGTPPVVTSLSVIPYRDISFDQLWMVVKRYINGSVVYTIEYMTKIFDDSIAQADAFQFDCGGTYDNPIAITGITIANPAVVDAPSHGFSNGNEVSFLNIVGLNISATDINGNVTVSNVLNGSSFFVANVTTDTFTLVDINGNVVSTVGAGPYVSSGQVRKMVTTISNLTWLANETVSVLADGGIHPDVVVSNSGSITLQYAAAKVQIGYKYNSDGKLLRAEAGAADGTSIGKTRRTHKVAFMLRHVGDLAFGTSFNNLLPVNFAQFNYNSAPIVPFFSGIYRDGLESAYDFDSQVCFRQNTGLPGTIQAITTFMEEQDDV